jgi:hypothetical protein
MRFLTGMTVLLLALICAGHTTGQAGPRDDERREVDRTVRPYLYFTPGTIENFKAKLKKEPFASRWKLLIRAAEEFAGKPVSDQSVIGTDRAAGAASMLDTLCLAYAVTGEKRYGERAKKEVWSLLSQKTWHEPKDWNKGAELCTAECCYGCARFYDWCHDTMTDDERKHFRERACELGLKPYLASANTTNLDRIEWWALNWASYWCGVCNGGCGLLGLALRDELPEAAEAASVAHSWLYKYLDNGALLHDGDNGEGVACWRHGVRFALAFYTAYDHMSHDNFWRDINKVRESATGYWDVYMQGPDQRYANFNEMDEETFKGLWSKDPADLQGGPSADLNALFETRTAGGDPLLLWAADNGGDGSVSANWFLWRRDTGPAGEKPRLDRNVLFRNAGHAILSSDSLWLACNGGLINGIWWARRESRRDRAHKQFDLGSFVLVCNGERFIHDPGRGHPETGKHSTIVINGASQFDESWAIFRAFHEGEKFSWFMNDLSGSYGAAVKRVKRSMIMVNGKYVVILDDVETAGSTDIDVRFQTRCGIALSQTGAVLTGRGKLSVTTATPVVAVTTGETCQGVRHLSLKARNPAAAVLFVTVLYPGEAPPISWNSDADTASLTVGDDVHEFSRSEETWVPRKISGESVPEPTPPTERTFKLFSDG